jgi:4,5-DOPA dioxygenase extradiol
MLVAMATLPTLFLSRGSPMHALEAGRAGAAWVRPGERIGRPRAVLVASAHWESECAAACDEGAAGDDPRLWRLCSGLDSLRYSAPGAPGVAWRAIELLRAGGMPASADDRRGLDRGAWVPLRHLYPAADVPVTQTSVQPRLPAAHRLQVGRLLAPLAREGVLIVGSGRLTHNLREWLAACRRGGGGEAPGCAPYVAVFRAWVDAALRDGDANPIDRWAVEAPGAALHGCREAQPGSRSWCRSHHLMQRWAMSTGSRYMSGQPPTMQSMPSSRHRATAASFTLPWPKERWNQTLPTPCSAHWRTRPGVAAGAVAITRPSIGPGAAPRSG